MKIEIEIKTEEDKKIDYPKLVVSKTSGNIVLMQGLNNEDKDCFRGTMIGNAYEEQSSYLEIGFYSSKWRLDNFVDYHGKVVLKN